jgi:hypothetical protein
MADVLQELGEELCNSDDEPISKSAHNSGLVSKAAKPYKPYPKQHLNYAIRMWTELRDDLKAKHPGIDAISLSSMVTPDARHAFELHQLRLKHPGVPVDKPLADSLRLKWAKVIDGTFCCAYCVSVVDCRSLSLEWAVVMTL